MSLDEKGFTLSNLAKKWEMGGENNVLPIERHSLEGEDNDKITSWHVYKHWLISGWKTHQGGEPISTKTCIRWQHFVLMSKDHVYLLPAASKFL